MKEVVTEEVGRAMERLEGLFERKHLEEDQRPSVAEVVKPKVSFPNLRAQPTSRENIVVAYPPIGPKDGPRDASVETKKRLVELMKPKDDLLQVRNMRPISKGGVLVKAAYGQAAGMFFENQALKDSGFMVSRPSLRVA